MTTQELIDSYHSVVIQIATPTSTGSGFYLKDYGVIVTNHHVVRGNTEVTISGRKLKRASATVCFTDTRHDLAFLAVPDNEIPRVSLGKPSGVRDGEEVIAIGHPFGLDYTATVGIVSKAERQQNGVNYIQIDAAINPGNSGGPLINMAGEIVGVNSFIFQNADGLGFALPVNPLIENLNDYKPYHGKLATRCASCGTMVTEETIDSNEYCPSCGAKVQLTPPEAELYKPQGVVKEVEEVIAKLGKEVKLSRRGPNAWEVEEGSAKIKITYNQQSYFIVADAFLCNLPKQNIGPIYEYLLRENEKSGGLLFSISAQSVVLSCLIYDEYFNQDAGLEMFNRLFKKADEYDDVLIKQYGALARADEA